MNQTSFYLNSKFHQTFKIIQQQQQLSSSIQPMAYSTYQFINKMFLKHQHQQSFMKSFQVHQIITSSFTIFHKNTTYSYIWFLTHEFLYQQHLIIQFTCSNISSTIRHGIIHQISQKHLFSKSLNWIITYEKG